MGHQLHESFLHFAFLTSCVKKATKYPFLLPQNPYPFWIYFNHITFSVHIKWLTHNTFEAITTSFTLGVLDFWDQSDN